MVELNLGCSVSIVRAAERLGLYEFYRNEMTPVWHTLGDQHFLKSHSKGARLFVFGSVHREAPG